MLCFPATMMSAMVNKFCVQELPRATPTPEMLEGELKADRAYLCCCIIAYVYLESKTVMRSVFAIANLQDYSSIDAKQSSGCRGRIYTQMTQKEKQEAYKQYLGRKQLVFDHFRHVHGASWQLLCLANDARVSAQHSLEPT